MCRVYDQAGTETLYPNGIMEGTNLNCSDSNCALFLAELEYGIMQDGSSGSGWIHEGGVGACSLLSCSKDYRGGLYSYLSLFSVVKQSSTEWWLHYPTGRTTAEGINMAAAA